MPKQQPKQELKIEMGDRGKDRITGLTGIVVAITEWLYGCRRITLQPEKTIKGAKGYGPEENHTFDEPQVAVVKKGVVEYRPFWRDPIVVSPALIEELRRDEEPRRRTAGPQPAPERRLDPR